MDMTETPLDTNELPWMLLKPGIWAKPLRLEGEERTLQLKVDPGATIAPHRHDGFVHAYTVSGSRRLGNGAVAGPGTYVYEPPSNADTWSCEGDEPCIVQITMSGRLTDVDEHGRDLDYVDTARLRRLHIDWCRSQGIAPWAAAGGEKASAQVAADDQGGNPQPARATLCKAADGEALRGSLAGEVFGGAVSVIAYGTDEIGAGPRLHVHPYDETFVVVEGRARFYVGPKVLDAVAGEVVLGPAGIPHRFKNLGPGRLQTIDIHQSPRFIQADIVVL